MKNKAYFSLLAVVILCMAGWTGYTQGGNSKRQTWEYREVPLNPNSFDPARETLNPLGADGWELVTIFFQSVEGTSNQRNAVAYLKRAK
jgi:hypothetical protein